MKRLFGHTKPYTAPTDLTEELTYISKYHQYDDFQVEGFVHTPNGYVAFYSMNVQDDSWGG